jgi:pimeloyl-ACP methyl ester carboxylesterase
MGVSMGGYNAAQLLLKTGRLFDRVALVCPALVTFDPFDQTSMQNYVVRTGANQILAQGVAAVLRKYYADPATWQADSPLVVGGQVFSAQTTPFHISCGVNDEMGFYEGAQAFAQLAVANQAPVTWKPLPGGHCAIDAPEVASYLAP